MMKLLDRWLNGITMYRLVAFYLAGLVAVAAALSFTKVLPFDAFALLFTTGFLIAACWLTNAVLAKAFRVPANVESAYISALILALIVAPLSGYRDLIHIGWMAVLAMASKYLIAPLGKHIFNPVVFAVAVTALTIDQTASWWIANLPMLPFVLVGGLLVVRKVQRTALVAAFLGVATFTSIVLGAIGREPVLASLDALITGTPLLFFAFAILTEPLSMPPTQGKQLIYGAITGFLFSPQVHLGAIYITPELAMLAANLYSYLVSPKSKVVLRLKEKIHLGADVWDFVFVPNRPLSYAPGQYMEWTLGHPDPDNRGNRRYFTLASSPTEPTLRLGVKFPPRASSFKRSMLAMDVDTPLVAAQLAGDFTLPDDPARKCVLIAGGIGITPFRSMVKYLVDHGERRPLVLFYAARTHGEIVYRDVFDPARQSIGLKTIYTLTDASRAPLSWKGRQGYIDAAMIKAEVPDYARCLFYLSGPNAMVASFQQALAQMGVHANHIRTDFFPGFS